MPLADVCAGVAPHDHGLPPLVLAVAAILQCTGVTHLRLGEDWHGRREHVLSSVDDDEEDERTEEPGHCAVYVWQATLAKKKRANDAKHYEAILKQTNTINCKSLGMANPWRCLHWPIAFITLIVVFIMISPLVLGQVTQSYCEFSSY